MDLRRRCKVAVECFDAYSAACIVAILRGTEITLYVYSGVSENLSIVRTGLTLQSEEQHTLHARSRLFETVRSHGRGGELLPGEWLLVELRGGTACGKHQPPQRGFLGERSSYRWTGDDRVRRYQNLAGGTYSAKGQGQSISVMSKEHTLHARSRLANRVARLGACEGSHLAPLLAQASEERHS
jgi:hypothetical protein